jgi:NADPH-dependent 2,4-dienoyl-CoA reductase/sulfur reductase-like enzyme/nitrite reductase/ring-hydroxylating ferredoxin subunit
MTDRDLSNGVLTSELHDGGKIAGRLGDQQLVLVRDGERVHAIGATCSHYGGPLADGAVTNGTIRCPWHHACFDLSTGAVLRAPALAPMPVWRVEQRDGRWFISDRVETAAVVSSPGPESVVIVGTGAAAANVADTLRAEGYGGRIVMIGGETDLPYDKPNLSKDFLAGKAPAEWLPLHPLEHYEDQRIELRLGVTVASVDMTARCITTSTEERLPFDALVLATGAAPRLLRVPGAEHVHYLRSRGDAERLVARAASARRAVVIGSSFIGLEVAASLRQKGLDVTVTSPDRIPLARILGEEVGAHIRSIHEQHGVVFRLGRSVVAIEGNRVALDDGSHVEGELIVAGIGVSPSVDLARNAGIAVADGILTDQYLETSAPNVYACGDVASFPDVRTNERIRVEHWVVAGRQGQTVARNILGRRERFATVPFFWSAHFDVVINYVGHASSWDVAEIDGSLDRNDATITYRRANRVLAVATIGRDAVSLAAEEAMEREIATVTSKRIMEELDKDYGGVFRRLAE